MKFIRNGLFSIVGLFFIIGYGQAQTLFKCELQGGKIAFQDTPCVQGKESARIETRNDKEQPKNKPASSVAPEETSAPQSAASKSMAPPPKPLRCPFTPVAGTDTKLVAQQQDMFTELFYVDGSRYSEATQSAPSAPISGQSRRAGDAKIAKCRALSEEYEAVGYELLKVPPKSLLSVKACFQKESQRLDSESSQLGCGFRHLRLK